MIRSFAWSIIPCLVYLEQQNLNSCYHVIAILVQFLSRMQPHSMMLRLWLAQPHNLEDVVSCPSPIMSKRAAKRPLCENLPMCVSTRSHLWANFWSQSLKPHASRDSGKKSIAYFSIIITQTHLHLSTRAISTNLTLAEKNFEFIAAKTHQLDCSNLSECMA